MTLRTSVSTADKKLLDRESHFQRRIDELEDELKVPHFYIQSVQVPIQKVKYVNCQPNQFNDFYACLLGSNT